MLNEFITKLACLLNQYEISDQEKEDIINDYKQMIEDGIERKLPQKTIIEMIGSPEKIVKELGFHHKKSESKRKANGEKLIALSPFISFIIFLILGFTKELWHPGWMVFLLIPITAIIVELSKKGNYMLTALSPFLSIAFFIIFGSLYELWHPTWLIFLLIPIMGIIESKSEMDNKTFFTALSPFISLISFILLQYFTGDFKYSWLVFLLIIFLGLLHEDNRNNKAILFTSLLLSTILYLLIMIIFGNWLALLSFSIFVIAGIYTGNINIDFDGESKVFALMTIILSFASFIGVGYYFDLWAVSWLFLFIIPVSFILKYNKTKPTFTPLSPFISVALLVILGYFFNLWYISWIALLLIPITAIIEDK